MNIFYVDSDPIIAAQCLVDKHVIKMILESAQLLSTAHRILDGKEITENVYINGSSPAKYRKKKRWVLDDNREDILYKCTHQNHPSAIWARQSVENYNWLVDHLFALSDEYTYRYGKYHATMGKLAYLIQSPPLNLKEWDMTPMPSCMDKEYIISENVIDNYRNYYKVGKARMHSWKKREAPSWIL